MMFVSMKKRRIPAILSALALLVALAVSMACPVPAETASAILYDGEAERSLDSCLSWIMNEGKGEFGIDETVTRDGKPSLRLSATESNIVDVNYFWPEGVTVPAGAKVKVSGYVKAEDLTVSGAGVRLLCGEIGLAYAVGISGTADWTAFETTVTVSEEKPLSGKNLCFDANGCAGKVWFQGVRLEIVKDEPPAPQDPNVLYDGEAERSLDSCLSWIMNEGKGEFGIDETVTRDGKPSLRLSATESNIVDVNYFWPEGVTVPAGAKVKVSGYVKAEDLTVSGAGVRLLCGEIGLAYAVGISGTADWTAFETTVTVSEEKPLSGKNLCFDANGCAGKVWFQGVRLEIVKDEPPAPQDPNVLYDGEAERSLDGGTAWIYKEDGTGAVEIDETVMHDGKPSLHLKATDENIVDFNYWLHDKKLDAGTRVKLSGYVKTKDLVVKGSGARILFGALNISYTAGLTGTNDWTYFELSMISWEDKDLDQANICYDMHGAIGDVWFQGVKLEITEKGLAVKDGVFYDGEAEQDPAGYPSWIYSGDGPAMGSVAKDTEVTRDGKPSLRFSATASSIVDLYVPLDKTVPAGKGVKVSGWIKTKDLDSTGTGMSIVLEKKDGEAKKELIRLGSVAGTTDWTFFEQTYTAAEDTLLSQVFFNMNWSIGTAWLSGVKVELVAGEQIDPDDPPYLPPEDDDDDIFDGNGPNDNDSKDPADDGKNGQDAAPVTGVADAAAPAALLAAVCAATAAVLRKRA